MLSESYHFSRSYIKGLQKQPFCVLIESDSYYLLGYIATATRPFYYRDEPIAHVARHTSHWHEHVATDARPYYLLLGILQLLV